jgi:hypothetical protein
VRVCVRRKFFIQAGRILCVDTTATATTADPICAASQDTRRNCTSQLSGVRIFITDGTPREDSELLSRHVSVPRKILRFEDTARPGHPAWRELVIEGSVANSAHGQSCDENGRLQPSSP